MEGPSYAAGLSGGWVKKIHHAPPQPMIEPDRKPAPTNGKFSFGVHVSGDNGNLANYPLYIGISTHYPIYIESILL